MSGYYLGLAQQERILASFNSIKWMAATLYNAIEESPLEDFDPSDFLARLDNLTSEALFLRQYVEHNFLSGENEPLPVTSDE